MTYFYGPQSSIQKLNPSLRQSARSKPLIYRHFGHFGTVHDLHVEVDPYVLKQREAARGRSDL